MFISLDTSHAMNVCVRVYISYRVMQTIMNEISVDREKGEMEPTIIGTRSINSCSLSFQKTSNFSSVLIVLQSKRAFDACAWFSSK